VTPRNSSRWGSPITCKGTLTLFGFPDTGAELEMLPRSRGWRALRAAAFVGSGLLLAPAVGLFPPHAPWAAAALGLGGFLGLRKWRERFTLLSLRGSCPKCGGSVGIREGTPLRRVISVPCEGCNHESRLVVELHSDLDHHGPGREGTDRI
jgi:hypothetical protein